MIKHGLCCCARLDFLDGLHAPLDTYKIALYNENADLDCDEVMSYTDANEVIGPGYEAGGLILQGRRTALMDKKACMTFDTPIWGKTSITARGALIYNATRGNKALGVIDFGKNFTSQNGPFSVEMAPLDPSLSLIIFE